MPGEVWWEITVFVLLWLYVGQLGGKTGLFLPFPLRHSRVSASTTPQACLGYSATCPVQGMLSPGERGAACHTLVLLPTHYRYTWALPRTSPSDHLGCWYNTTIPSKDYDIALGEQSSHRQGKGCMENWDTGKKQLELPSGLWAEPPQQLLTLWGGKKKSNRVEGRHAPVPSRHIAQPPLPISAARYFCKTLSAASTGSYSPVPSSKERKEAVSAELGVIKEACGYVWWFRI